MRACSGGRGRVGGFEEDRRWAVGRAACRGARSVVVRRTQAGVGRLGRRARVGGRRAAGAAVNEEQPRDEHGRFAETDGSGGGSLGKWAEKRVATHIQSGDSVRAQLEKTGAKAFEGVPAAAVREVHHYDGQTGLKLVVKRNDGARDRYIYTDEHHQKQAEYRFARAQQMVEAVGAT